MCDQWAWLKALILDWSLQGFPGDMGSPGENGHEGPKVTEAAVKWQTFFSFFFFFARVYCHAAGIVFFRAELTKGMTLIKCRLSLNGVRVDVDWKIVCRRNRQSLGSWDVLFSCFGLMLTPLTCVSKRHPHFIWTHFCISFYLTTGLFPSRENQGWGVYLGHGGCLA